MKQEVLISTVHNMDNVVETFLNPAENLVSELIYSFKGQMHVTQMDLDTYLNKDSGYKGVSQEIINALNR